MSTGARLDCKALATAPAPAFLLSSFENARLNLDELQDRLTDSIELLFHLGMHLSALNWHNSKEL